MAEVPSGVIGVHAIPRSIEPTMRYRRPPETTLAARVQLLVGGATGEPTFDGKQATDLITSGDGPWNDINAAPLGRHVMGNSQPIKQKRYGI